MVFVFRRLHSCGPIITGRARRGEENDPLARFLLNSQDRGGNNYIGRISGEERRYSVQLSRVFPAARHVGRTKRTASFRATIPRFLFRAPAWSSSNHITRARCRSRTVAQRPRRNASAQAARPTTSMKSDGHAALDVLRDAGQFLVWHYFKHDAIAWAWSIRRSS